MPQLDQGGATDGQGMVWSDSLNMWLPATVVLGLVEGAGITIDDTDPANPIIAASGGGGGATELLGVTAYNPGSTASPTTTSRYDTVGFADVDATNVAVAFTAPATGDVLVRASIRATTSSGPLFLALREGSTTLTGTGTGDSADGLHRRAPVWLITGLTAGDAHTYKLAWAVVNGSSATASIGGGNAVPHGPAVLEVWAAP